MNEKHLAELDANHFLYSTYYLNYQRNVAHEFLRMYYMMEVVGRDKNNFDLDIWGEYRDYYTVFAQKYGFTPTQYSSFLFGELITYYSDVNSLICNSMWRNIEGFYGQIKEKELISKVINILSCSIEAYKKWAIESENQEWDFGNFFELPFIKDKDERYISICDITLRNAFFEKIFWLIRECYPQADKSAMAFFGGLFEKYIQDVTEKATNGDYEYIAEFSYKEKKKEKKSSYAYIRKGTNLLVVEVKGFSVLIDCMIKNEQVEKNNEKLFVKPVLQADLCLSMIIEDKTEFFGIEDAYIISVTMDNINAVPDYYNEIHKNIQKREVCEKTKYYYNFSVEEYEMLMYLLERQYDVFGILRDYYNSKALRPFSNYLQERYEDIGMTDFMEDLYDKASKRMKELAFPCG